MTILAHMQGKNIDHYSTGLCIKKFSVIIMCICHAVKTTTMWFCGGGAHGDVRATVTELMPLVVQLSQAEMQITGCIRMHQNL
jgi:hypothetical protein